MPDAFLVRTTLCPACGATLNAFGVAPGETDDRGPAAGDYSVCAYCLQVLVFNADLTYRIITAEEWTSMPAEVKDSLIRTQASIQRVGFDRREPRPT